MNLGQARDQGQRPTCLSFAISELHHSKIAIAELLSPESLHQLAGRRVGKPPSAALQIGEAVNSLATDGQTSELAWPYGSPSPVDPSAHYFKTKAFERPYDPTWINAQLTSGQPAVLVVDVDTTFYSYTAGEILAFNSAATIQARHAVALCGMRNEMSQYCFLVKNSWGSGWGDAGYAWLEESYILARNPTMLGM